MNIKDLHTEDKAVSAISLFKSEKGNATSIRILKDQLLKEHINYGISKSERNEREDWAYEVALLMRNRFILFK